MPGYRLRQLRHKQAYSSSPFLGWSLGPCNEETLTFVSLRSNQLAESLSLFRSDQRCTL